jgi:hypothetical protein
MKGKSILNPRLKRAKSGSKGITFEDSDDDAA